MKQVIYDVVLDAKDGTHPATFSRTMTHPARSAYAGVHYKHHSRWGQTIVGLTTAVLVIFALIGIAACRHL